MDTLRLSGTVGEQLRAQGVSRRGFMKFCATTASLMALSPTMVPRIAEALASAKRAIQQHEHWLKSRFNEKEVAKLIELLTRIHD